jgi:tetratricopeptide (TPR) repeat protein
MALPPSHPLRLLRFLCLGALLPLLLAFGVLAGGLWLLVQGVMVEDGGIYMGLGVGLLTIALPALYWLFRTGPRLKLDRVSSKEAPDLHELLTKVEQGMKGVKARKVWLVRGFQVHLHTRPMLGPLGWASHGWVIGAFSLMHLTPREFEATLLWDQAYWSRQHGWLNLETKRVLQFWTDLERVLESLAAKPHARKGATWATRDLIRRVARWFSRATGPFLFDQILMADRSVSIALGAHTTAQMLLKEGLTRYMVDELWWPDWVEKQTQAEGIAQHPLSEVQTYLKQVPPDAVLARLQGIANGDLPGPAALRSRLEALGTTLQSPLPPQRSAFEAYLQDSAAAVTHRMETLWQKEVEAVVGRRRQALKSDQTRYRLLAKRLEDWHPLTPTERLELGKLAVAVASEEEALTYLEDLVESLPRSGDAWTLRARYLINHGYVESGQAALEKLRALHPLNAAIAAELWADHVERRGTPEEAQEARVEAYRLARKVELARAERRTVLLKDPMGPHKAPEDLLEQLRGWLATYPEIKKAYLVQKRVLHLPESPVYFLGLVPKRSWWPFGSQTRRLALQKRLAQESAVIPDAKLFLIVLGGPLRRQVSRFKAIPGSAFYP